MSPVFFRKQLQNPNLRLYARDLSCFWEILLSTLFTRPETHKNRRQRRISVFVCSLVTLIGLACVNPTHVEATCGDYLAHSNHRDHVQSADFESDRSNPSAQKHHSGRPPCQGPFCQQAPLDTPLSAPVVTIEPQDRWGWRALIMEIEPQQVSFLAHLRAPISLPTVNYPLDRPPKAGRS
jgi:hypothetical protein